MTRTPAKKKEDSLARASGNVASAILGAFAASLGWPATAAVGIVGGAYSSLEDEVAELRVKINAMRVRHLISESYLKSESFVFRINEIVEQLKRTAQEEKREYLLNGLLNVATGTLEEDDITLYLALLEPLTLRHVVLLDDLVGHSRLAGDSVAYNDEDLKRLVVWNRLKGAFGAENPTSEFDLIVQDLLGRGLIQPHKTIWGEDSNRILAPSPVVHALMAFVESPVQ